MSKKLFRRGGFTLVELVIVIAIIGILAAVVFVAVDPARRLHASRNATRWSDVTAIVGAIKQYQADNEGNIPGTTLDSVTGTYQMIGEGVGATACASLAATCTSNPAVVSAGFPGTNCYVSDLDTTLVAYLKRLPKDPSTSGSTSGTLVNTQYYINKDANGLIVVGACQSEGEGAGGTGTPPLVEVSY